MNDNYFFYLIQEGKIKFFYAFKKPYIINEKTHSEITLNDYEYTIATKLLLQ